MKKIWLFLLFLNGAVSVHAMRQVRSGQELKDRFPLGITLERLDRVDEAVKAILMNDPRVSEKRRRQLIEYGGFVERERVVGHYFMHGAARLYTRAEDGAYHCIDPFDRWKVIRMKSNL